ncbi:MAG: hypothetical protein ACRD1F_01610 [Terriglobales bacterium]
MSTQQAVQLSQEKPAANGFRDSAFAGNRELPVHRWVPWIAGFSAQFVDDAIGQYLPVKRRGVPRILDPFAGVGTTLVQAYTHGFDAVGFEINPYAALAVRTKLEAARLKPKTLRQQIGGFEEFMARACAGGNRRPRSVAPPGFTGRMELFSPAIERKVLFVLDYIGSIEEPAVRDLFLVALGSVMVSFSNYSYEPSLTRRTAVGREPVLDAEVAAVVALKLRLMQTDVEWLQRGLAKFERTPHAEIFDETFFSAREHLRKGSVDLAITSPPYLNNYHYPRNTRPQLHWLGLATGRGYQGAREDSSFGKFWQTVRDKETIALAFSLRSLEENIGEIRRRNPEKGVYGGHGWANYAATYFNDTHRFCTVLAEVLKSGAAAVVVLGNSIIQGVEIRTDEIFGTVAELCGLVFENRIMLREKRTGTSIIQSAVRTDKAARKTVLYESAIVLRKKEEGRRKMGVKG